MDHIAYRHALAATLQASELLFSPQEFALCLRRPGEWGIGLSDTVRVTETGAVPLTDNDWQLHEQIGDGQ